MAGSVYTAPTEPMRRSLSTHSASRLLRILDNTATRLVSARGIRLVADGMVHLGATTLLQSQTPSHIVDFLTLDYEMLWGVMPVHYRIWSALNHRNPYVADYTSHSREPQHTHLFTDDDELHINLPTPCQ